jgi:hypothetical protein
MEFTKTKNVPIIMIAKKKCSNHYDSKEATEFNKVSRAAQSKVHSGPSLPSLR